MNQTPRTAALAAHGRSPAKPARRRPRHISATAATLCATLCATLALTGCLPRQEIAAPPSHPDVFEASSIGLTLRDGGDLVMALSAEPDKLDPTTSSSLYTRYVMESMCQKLYDIDSTGSIVPLLATALPTTSPDGRTVTIPVRTGARFADGTAFNAAAVKTTLERHLSLEGSARKGEMGPVASIAAPTDDTVVITFERPYAPITAALADRAGMIMSPTALAASGTNFAANPVCVGPFKFTQRIPQTSISLERDPLYYDADSVHLDTITYRIMADANIRAANIRSGDVQVADAISTQDIDALVRDDNLGTLQVGSLGYQALTINVGNVAGTGEPPGVIDTPLATDPRVRQALSMSIDREALVSTVFNGWYSAACSPISPASPFASAASNACPPYDPEGAKRLLADAGVQTPYLIDMKVSNSQDTLRLAQALQASLEGSGFSIRIIPVEYSTLLDDQDRGDFSMLQLGWSGRVDPSGNMQNFLGTGGGNNYSGVSDPQIDDLLQQAAQSTDVAERSALYGRVVTRVQEINPIIYLYRQRSLIAYSKQVTGLKVYADGVVHLSGAAFVEEAK